MLLYFIIEKQINDRCLRSFRAVIHVNGIRGKTSTCRYIDAALRSRYRVFTKTTGTDAMYIDTNGNEYPVRRFGPANLHEQIRTIRKAKKEGAEILILECMAVNPELQEIAQEQIVKSSITVITNVRYDHIFEMGDTLTSIAASLSATIPENGTLYTAEPRARELFGARCQERNCRLVVLDSTGTQSENIGIARAIAASFSITEEEFLANLPNVHEDFGIRTLYPVQNSAGEVFHFLNLFSANDPQSTRSNVESERSDFSRLYFLYNHREDRPDRALLFARYFFPYYKECTVFITGRGAALPARLFRGAGVSGLHILKDTSVLPSLPPGSLLVGIGNIKGAGYRIITTLEEEKRKHE